MNEILGVFSWTFIIYLMYKRFHKPKFIQKNSDTYDSKYLNIIRQNQVKTNWCWIACASMLSEYFDYKITQEEIIRHIRGDQSNKGGYPIAFKRALAYATGRRIGWYFRLSLNNIKILIDNNIPIVISVKRKRLFSKGHAVLVTGYENDNLYIVDPGKNCKSGLYSYHNLCKGTQMSSGYGKYLQSFVVLD
ncbi:MAG: C39 family peptidase [Suipraeoptans sp.]